MNLIKLTQKEVNNLRLGDVHSFKKGVMHTSRDISEFDLFKDIDSINKDIYVAPKNDPYANPEYSGISLY